MTEPEELLADIVQCPKCEWWTNAPKSHAATCPADRPYPIPDLKDAEIARLRGLLREVINGAWEMDFEDRHTIDSEIIGKIASYLLAVTPAEDVGREQ